MPHLVETYSLATGLRIDKMSLYEHFIPLPEGFDDYILVSTGSGMASKNYSYFADILWIIRKELQKANIKVIQVGLREDEKIGSDLDLCGSTSTYQYFSLVKGARLVLCNDSSILHIAGHYDIPTVALFGITDPKISGAYFGQRVVHLTPDLEGHYPSFDPNEKPKTVDRILPETAAQKVLDFLGLSSQPFESIHLGTQYRFQALEVIPDHVIDPRNFTKSLLNIRYDYGGEENICYAYLSQRKCNIITDKPLNVDILSQVLPNIGNIVYDITAEHKPKFVEEMHRAGIPYVLISYLPKEEIKALKFDYLNFNVIHAKTRATRADLKRPEKVSSSSEFRSNKYILSAGKIYLSRAHLRHQAPIANFENNCCSIIDTDEFWRELEFFYVFNRFSLNK